MTGPSRSSPASTAAGSTPAGSTASPRAELDALDDSEIVRRVREGNADSFEALVRRHGSRVRAVVSRHVPAQIRDELVQDTFVRAYSSLRTFQLGTRFGDWLSGIAVRSCHDHWRGHYHRREVPESQLGATHLGWMERASAAQSEQEFAAATSRQDAHEVLQYALERLSPDDRMVVSLVHLEGLSVREAAQQLGWTEVNVKVRAHRARLRMRKELERMLSAAQLEKSGAPQHAAEPEDSAVPQQSAGAEKAAAPLAAGLAQRGEEEA